MVARVDGMTEDEPALEPAPGAEARAAKVARAKPLLSAGSAPLRDRLGFAKYASSLPPSTKKLFELFVERLPGEEGRQRHACARICCLRGAVDVPYLA